MADSSQRPSLYTRLASGVLFPLHERAKTHSSVALRRKLERTQWLSAGQIAEIQSANLRDFIARIARDVPYYRDLFVRESIDPASIRTAGDLTRLPFLTKPLIRAQGDALRSQSAGKLIKYNTGGSSGEPLVFWMGSDRVSHDVAAKWRATRWWGVDIGDVEAVLWGSPIEIGRQDRLKALRDRLFRSYLLPAFAMGDEQMDSHLARIVQLRPRMMFGYASALDLLSRHAARRGVRLDGLGTRVVFATGETLYPEQRENISRTFGALVANGYGARDAGFVAHECPSGGMHLSAEHVIVEIVDANGQQAAPGELGEIVVTHLGTVDFPFVRYRTGDMAALSRETCPCGRGLPLLAKVSGRSTDFIVTPTGVRMHALALIYEVRDKPGVRAFKFVQEPDLSIELQVVRGPEFNERVANEIYSGLAARLGADARLFLRYVDSIAPEKSGKYRYVISKADTTLPRSGPVPDHAGSRLDNRS